MQRLCRLAHRAVVRPCIACFLVLLLQCVGGVGEIQSSNENTAAINLWRVIARIYTLKSKCKLERNQTKICVGSNKLARAGANKNLTLDIALHAGLNRVHGVRQRGCNNASPNTPNKLGSPRRPSFALGGFFCVFFKNIKKPCQKKKSGNVARVSRCQTRNRESSRHLSIPHSARDWVFSRAPSPYSCSYQKKKSPFLGGSSCDSDCERCWWVEGVRAPVHDGCIAKSCVR